MTLCLYVWVGLHGTAAECHARWRVQGGGGCRPRPEWPTRVMASEAKGQGRRQLFHDRRVQDADTADETLESDAADQQGINSLLNLSSVPCRDLEGHDPTALGRFLTAMDHGDDDSPGELDQAVGTYDDGLEQVRILLHAPFGVSE